MAARHILLALYLHHRDLHLPDPQLPAPQAAALTPEAWADTAPEEIAAYLRTTVSAASPICSDFQTFCPDWLHFGHFLCFGGIAASQLSHRIFPIYF